MSVYFRSDRNAWCVDTTDEWNRRHRKFLTSETAARTLEASLQRSIAQARADLQRGELPELKLSEGIQIFLTTLAASATTRSHNAQRLAALVKLVGDPMLRDVTPQMLAAYQDRRRPEVSAATLAYEAQVIHRCLRTLSERGYVAANAAAGLPRKEPHSTPGRELSADEEKRILAAATPRIRLRLLLALDAGLRRGEIMQLRRRDWNDREQVLTVWRPKTRTLSQIPTTSRLAAALQEISSQLQPDSVIQSYGGRAVGKGTDFLKKLRARTSTSFRLHDLRHTFATRLRRAAPFEVVRLLLGHSFSNVTERYIHPSLEDCRRAIAAMEAANPLTKGES